MGWEVRRYWEKYRKEKVSWCGHDVLCEEKNLLSLKGKKYANSVIRY